MNIVSVGNIYLDINVSGLDSRADNTMSPELEYSSDTYETKLGGSAVIAPYTMAKLGLDTTFIGSVGLDQTGNIVQHLLKQSNIRPILMTSKDVNTNVGINVQNQNGKTYMIVSGNANQYLSNEFVEKHIIDNFADFDLLYLGGAFKLPKLSDTFIKLAKLFYENGKYVFLDHGRVPANQSKESLQDYLDRLLPYITFYAPSEEDISNVWGNIDIHDISAKYPKLTIHLKLGERGSMLISTNTTQNIPAKKISSISPNFVGAGDASNAGFIYGYDQTRDIINAAQIANQTSQKHIDKISIL